MSGKILISSIALLSLLACGKGSSSTSANSGNADSSAPQQENSVPKTIQCGENTCDAKSQYCFKLTSFPDGPEGPSKDLYTQCMQLPQNCGDCGCAQADALKQESSNCQSGIGCDQSQNTDNDQSSNRLIISCFI